VSGLKFVVTKVETIRLSGPKALTDCQLMSPYVWEPTVGAPGPLSMLVRAVPPLGSSDPTTGRIWFAQGEADGLTFTADSEPLIVPGPGPEDIDGCEDPTVVPTDKTCLVYYTGLDAQGRGQMLYADGRDIHALMKQGVALASSKTENNTKEATVQLAEDGTWRLFYEYAANDHSLIGLAFGEGPAGPWHEQPQPFAPRPDNFDNWHLSTGPLLMTDPTQPVMFYNGASRDAHWGIDWAVFNGDCTKLVERCEGPLVAPPGDPDRDGRAIVFASSVIERDGVIHLYLSRDDRELLRATLERR
jgi:beta-1,2-mannobiose phosphorylase / 1,2-beta-oligomannan phosphorylase